MKRAIGGACIMLLAIALQFAMVVRVIEPTLWVGLGGYVLLFAGMFLAIAGALDRVRPH